MNWYSWLSKTGLDSSLAYEYGLTFTHNELEEEDLSYFNHEVLQSMGITVAKHRLEILKLARKEKASRIPRPVSRLFVAIKKTRKNLEKYIHTWACRQDQALVVVPKPYNGYSSKWRGAMLKRNKRVVMAASKQNKPLLLTNGSPLSFATPRIDSFSSSLDYNFGKQEAVNQDEDDDDDGYWSNGAEEIRWDSMFQNLKPT